MTLIEFGGLLYAFVILLTAGSIGNDVYYQSLGDRLDDRSQRIATGTSNFMGVVVLMLMIYISSLSTGGIIVVVGIIIVHWGKKFKIIKI